MNISARSKELTPKLNCDIFCVKVNTTTENIKMNASMMTVVEFRSDSAEIQYIDYYIQMNVSANPLLDLKN